MAVYQFSALSNGQAISFDPAADVLRFDQSTVHASRIVAYADGPNLHVTWADTGKYVLLLGVSPFDVTTGNIRFVDGSRLLFGDNSLTQGDDAANSLMGGAGADHLSGFGGSDTLIGLGGADWLEGGNGDDRLEGRDGNDVLSGGDDDDTLYGQAGADTMSGGAGDDVYGVDDPGDVVVEFEGGGSHDLVLSALDNYHLPDWVNDLTLTGSARVGSGNSLDNILTGNAGDNSLSAYGGNDRLVGYGGSDWLNGGAGVDTMIGGAGNDYYYVDDVGDVIVEGASGGVDRVFVAMDYTLPVGVEDLVLQGPFDGIGNALANRLYGSDYNNSLSGRGGNDTLNGGIGNDTLRGGDGADAFLFSQNPGRYDADVIRDFVPGTDAVLLLNGDPPEPGGYPGNHADYGPAGTLGADDPRFYSAAGATAGHDGDDRLIYNTTTGRLYYDPDGNGSEAAQLIYTLQGAPQLAATDITVLDSFAF